MTHEPRLSISLAALALGLAGCAGGGSPAGAQSPPGGPPGVTTTTSGPTTVVVVGPDAPPTEAIPVSADALTDEQIVAIVDSAGRAERELARDASKRVSSEHVRHLAQRVLSDHAAGRLDEMEKETSLVPRESVTSTTLTTDGAHAVERAGNANGRELDRIYLEALQGEERKLVQLLDDEMIPQARNGKLKVFLQEVRASLSSRLAMGQDASPATK